MHASNQALGGGGWRDGRHQLAILAAGVTAALQVRGVSRRVEPLRKRRDVAAPFAEVP